jgi:hypothetical protein
MGDNILSIVPSAEKEILSKIGDYRITSDLAYAEKLASEGINDRGLIGVWAEQIEKITKEVRRLEKLKEFFLEPTAEIKRQIEASRKKCASMFDSPIGVLEDAKVKLNKPYAEFVYRCQREDAEKAEALRMEAAAKAKAAAEEAKKPCFIADLEAEEAADMVKTEKTVTKVKTVTGSTSLRLIQRVKVIDKSKIPLRYLKFDEKEALEEFSSNGQPIPGIEFYKEPDTYIR